MRLKRFSQDGLEKHVYEMRKHVVALEHAMSSQPATIMQAKGPYVWEIPVLSLFYNQVVAYRSPRVEAPRELQQELQNIAYHLPTKSPLFVSRYLKKAARGWDTWRWQDLPEEDFTRIQEALRNPTQSTPLFRLYEDCIQRFSKPRNRI